eukprot:tig00000615_g2536.t1
MSRRSSISKYIVPSPGMPSVGVGDDGGAVGTSALNGAGAPTRTAPAEISIAMDKLETGSVHSAATGTESQILMEMEGLQERKTEDALFGTLFTMTSRNSQTKTRLSTRVLVFLFFTLLDFVQLIGLAYDDTVWSHDVVGWLSFLFEITKRLNALGRLWMVAFYYIAAVAVLTALGLLIYVGVLFKRDRFQMLPVKALRILVTILVTALYITVLEILIAPFDCVFSGTCLEIGSLVQMGISLFLLLVFMPFCLLMSLVFHDHEVHSPDLESRPTGRGDLLYLASRTVLVLARRFLWPYSPSFVGVLVGLAAGLQSGYTAVLLPYYRRPINTFKAWLFMSAAVFALGTVALRNATEGGRYAASIAVLVALVPLGAVSAALAEFRHYRISRAFLRIPAAHAAVLVAGGASQEEASATAAAAAAAAEVAEVRAAPAESAAASGGLTARLCLWGQSTHGGSVARSFVRRVRSVSKSVSALGGPLAAAIFDTREDGEGRELGGGAPGPFLLEQEVEVAVRFLRLARQPSPALLDAAEAVYKRGMQQFPKSAYVRITYASFLQSYRKNIPGAMVALKDAWQRLPPFDQRFWLSSIRRSWEQMNQGQSAGGESLSFIKMLEFKRLLTVTQAHHNQAVVHVRTFWRGLARKRVLLPAVLDNVGKKLEETRQVKWKADDGYRRLLTQYPQSKLLIRSYAAFLLHVGNEAEAAAVQFAKADEIEEAEMRERLANGGGGGSSIGTSSQGTSEDKGSESIGSSHSSSAKRKAGSGDFEIIQQENLAMKVLKVGIVLGIGALMALSAVSYAVIRDLFGGYDQSVKRNKGIIELLRMILEACHQTRSLSLAARENDRAAMDATVVSLSTMSETFLDAFRSIYMGINGVTRSSDPAVTKMWTEQTVHMQKYVSIPPAHYVDTYTSLWDGGNLFATKARQFSHSTEADWKDAHASDLFRYVTRNAMYGFQQAMEKAAGIYQQETALRRLEASL